MRLTDLQRIQAAEGRANRAEKKLARYMEESRRKGKELTKVKVKHAKLAATRQRQELFKPMYTEGRASIEALLKGTGSEQEFTPEQEGKLIELAAMLTDESLLTKYPSWRMRAIGLGITHNQLYTWRNSQRFHQILAEVLANDARLATAMAMPTQAAVASSRLDRGNTKAFAQLARMGGVSSRKAEKATAASKVSIETLILNMVGDAAGVKALPVETKVFDEPGPLKLPAPSKRHHVKGVNKRHKQ